MTQVKSFGILIEAKGEGVGVQGTPIAGSADIADIGRHPYH
jgi:hypothetical protein